MSDSQTFTNAHNFCYVPIRVGAHDHDHDVSAFGMLGYGDGSSSRWKSGVIWDIKGAGK